MVCLCCYPGVRPSPVHLIVINGKLRQSTLLSGGLALLYLGMGCTQGQSNAGLASRAARCKQRII